MKIHVKSLWGKRIIENYCTIILYIIIYYYILIYIIYYYIIIVLVTIIKEIFSIQILITFEISIDS